MRTYDDIVLDPVNKLLERIKTYVHIRPHFQVLHVKYPMLAAPKWQHHHDTTPPQSTRVMHSQPHRARSKSTGTHHHAQLSLKIKLYSWRHSVTRLN